MDIAISESKKSSAIDEVPVGAVIVKDNTIIATGHNMIKKQNSALMHAEMIAIQNANKKLKTSFLIDCSIYVTLEPCLMCGYAICLSKIKNVFFGCYDNKTGSFGGKINILELGLTNHKPNIYSEMRSKECKEIIKEFFKQKRNRS